MLFDDLHINQTNFVDRYPSLVIDLPVTFTDKRGILIRDLMPILFLRTETSIFVPNEIILWMMDEVGHRPLKILHNQVAAVGRLNAFHSATGSPKLENAEDVDVLIDGYLLARFTQPPDQQQQIMPLWNGVSNGTIRKELEAFSSLAKSVRLTGITSSPLHEALKLTSRVFDFRVKKKFHKSFFAHLETQWNRYQQLEGYTPQLSAPLRFMARRSEANYRGNHTMTREECDAIIEATPNIAYRTLFQAAAGTGGRISEYLHMFRCDLVPASYSHRLIGTSSDDPLLMFCDPARSPWIGKLNDMSTTREEYLHRTYQGRLPRTKAKEKKDRVGFKGMVFSDRNLFRIPIWLDSMLAQNVIEGSLELKRILQRSGEDKNHPYLFISTGNNDSRGNPMRHDMVEAAFVRSAKKVGLHGKQGIRIHGFRHLYVHYLRHELKFDQLLITTEN